MRWTADPGGTRPTCVRHRAVRSGLALLLAGGVVPVMAADDAPAQAAGAQAPAPPVPPFKFTLGYYDFGDFGGTDANLRYRRDDTSLWIGWYHDREFGRQTRAGADTSVSPWKDTPLSIQPSLQVATGNFIGGSLALQYGNPWYVSAGIGRTNLKPYVNLNFDPNDAISIVAGHQSDTGPSYYVSAIVDDRLGTQQRHFHANVRVPLHDGERVTFDLLRKQGQGDTGYVRAIGASMTYDFPRWFVRLAYDPKQNFGRYDVTRISTGIRF